MTEPQDLKNFDRKDIIAFDSQLFKVEQLFGAIKKAFQSDDIGWRLNGALQQQDVLINVADFEGTYREEHNEWLFDKGGEC